LFLCVGDAENLRGFANQRRAIEFEKYLKSGFGYTFAARHFR
jgi:hypothetical protein